MLGHREFYTVSDSRRAPITSQGGNPDPYKIVEYVNNQIIGRNHTFSSPFGGRCKSLYVDYIASGKSLEFIEDFIKLQILPTYANTHSTSTNSSMQTTMYRDEARNIFRNSVRASEADAVLFVDHGTTGAVHKLINGLIGGRNEELKIGIIIGPHEHHSNILPWREIKGSEIFLIKESSCGCVDLNHLNDILKNITLNKSFDLVVGCFSAVSNVTGRLVDDINITSLLHSYDAYAFWDYATAAPYVNIDMNPKTGDGLAYKDAIFFSCHKFVGGVQTPGVLVAKKKLFKNPIPNGGGGGSVFFVTEKDHIYLKETEVREEGGTPAIIESIRAGLVLQLKQSVGEKYIYEREMEIASKVRDKLSGLNNFVLLGGYDHRLPIYSFLIKGPQGGYLHYNYVTSLLNDLFGIQSRGGCACAGPYAQTLLGIDPQLAKRFESLLLEDSRLDRIHLRRGKSEYSGEEILRPGFTRINLPWFFNDEQVDEVLSALFFIAEHGWKLLPQYIFYNETGEWKHHTNLVFKERKWLESVSYSFKDGSFLFPNIEEKQSCYHPSPQNTLESCKKVANRLMVPDQRILFEQTESSELRWFTLPIEAKEVLINNLTNSITSIFKPKSYNSCTSECLSGSLKLEKEYEIYPWILNIPVLINKSSVISKQLPEIKTPKVAKEICDSKLVCTTEGCAALPQEIRRSEIFLSSKISKTSWQSPPKELFKPFLEAVEQFSMIKDGDRVLVCLSGGKDSLSLLHILRQYQLYVSKTVNGSVNFELGAMTVDPRSSAYDPSPLIPYLKELGVPYFYEEQDIMAQALEADCSSICAYCSRMKRGRIYATARREKYNVLAMGQHLDDLAESFLMSVFHNGRLRTMKANYAVKEGDLRLIRPLVYVRENNLRRFAESRKLPIIAENCPACFEVPKERHRSKQLLANQELIFPKLYWSLKTAMFPLMDIRKTGIENGLFGKGSMIEDE